jgi:hypothetical protein
MFLFTWMLSIVVFLQHSRSFANLVTPPNLVKFGVKVSACYETIGEDEADYFECRGSMDILDYTPTLELELHHSPELSTSWEEQCYQSVLYRVSSRNHSVYKYYKDFARQLFVCGLAGKGILRYKQPEFMTLHYEFEDSRVLMTNSRPFRVSRDPYQESAVQEVICGEVAGDKCMLVVTFRQGDVFAEVVKSLQHRHKLSKSATIELAHASHAVYVQAELPVDSPSWISIRYEYMSQWLRWLLQPGTVSSKRRFRTLGHDQAPITRFLDVVANYFPVLGEPDPLVKPIESTARQQSQLDGYSSSYHAEDTTLVILSCKRLSMFQRTMESLHRAVDPAGGGAGSLYAVFAKVSQMLIAHLRW